jgi:CheY-like chemotaxis protein
MRLPAAVSALDVLIADDDPLFRATVRSFLEGHGYTCAEAGDGREAVAVARDRRPRCVLLDLVMPELDGFAVARQLRSDPQTRRAHIHCLTGRTDPDSRRRAGEVGCESFLPKPVDPGAVLRAVGGPAGPDPAGWVTGLSCAEANDLLDWLEVHGYPPTELSSAEGQGFAVRRPPGFDEGRPGQQG